MTEGRSPAPAVFAGAGTATSASDPDVEIDASATAREVRALRRPRGRVDVSGHGAPVRHDDMTWKKNLPRELEPGEVRQDVRIRRRVAGRLAYPGSEG